MIKTDSAIIKDLINSEKALAQLQKETEALIEKAKKLNVVISIDLVSKDPLAMGNYEMVPGFRTNRNPVYISDLKLNEFLSSNYKLSANVYNDKKDWVLFLITTSSIEIYGLVSDEQLTKAVEKHRLIIA